MRKRRFAALMLCGLVLLFLLGSSALPAYHLMGRHRCQDQDCPICAAIRSGEGLLRSLACLGAVLFVLLTGVHAAFFALRARAASARPETLISLKVKLSD